MAPPPLDPRYDDVELISKDEGEEAEMTARLASQIAEEGGEARVASTGATAPLLISPSADEDVNHGI